MLARLRRLWHKEDGSIPIEGLYGTVLLVGWFVVAFQLYDAFRTRSLAVRASYTISDMISREENAIGPKYVAGVKKVFDFLVRARTPDHSWMRVTILSCPMLSETDKINCDGTTKQFRVESSYASKPGISVHTDASIKAEKDRIPAIAPGDSAVVLETSLKYFTPLDMGERAFRTGGESSFLSIGLNDRLRFSNFVVTRPRGPRTAWDPAR